MKTSNKIANFVWQKVFLQGGVLFTVTYFAFALAANSHNRAVNFNSAVALLLFSIGFSLCSAVFLVSGMGRAGKKGLHWLLTSICIGLLVVHQGQVATDSDISVPQVIILVGFWTVLYAVGEVLSALRRDKVKKATQNSADYENKFKK
ncbi:MAG: hypothetical protein FWB93_02005 [Oscillospiraceae bacterium]|nr:hypothetical protein [Oscillospiraceae bacterium]